MLASRLPSVPWASAQISSSRSLPQGKEFQKSQRKCSLSSGVLRSECHHTRNGTFPENSQYIKHGVRVFPIITVTKKKDIKWVEIG